MSQISASRRLIIFCLGLMLSSTISCSGGGGGDGSGDGNGGGGSGTDSVDVWKVEAGVTVDGCRERISDVNQKFTVSRVGDAVAVDDTLLTLSGVTTGDGFTAVADAPSVSCSRHYEVAFSGETDTTATVNLSVKSVCGANTCENRWSGVATKQNVATQKDEAVFSEEESLNPKVTGANCIPPIADIGYRPSLFECFGNSAVLARGNVRNAYSIVVRRLGQFNDRDPRNPSCGTAECSPYKTQQRIDLAPYRVNCLGASGFDPIFNEVTRISVKYTAAIEDKNDPRQFEQYCLSNKRADLN